MDHSLPPFPSIFCLSINDNPTKCRIRTHRLSFISLLLYPLDQEDSRPLIHLVFPNPFWAFLYSIRSSWPSWTSAAEFGRLWLAVARPSSSLTRSSRRATLKISRTTASILAHPMRSRSAQSIYRLPLVELNITEVDVINKLPCSLTMLQGNKALWLYVKTHITCISQSVSFISTKHS